MATRWSAEWAKRFWMAVLVLVAIASLSFPLARSAKAWFSQESPGFPVNKAVTLAQQTPPEVTTEDGVITLSYRFYYDGLPFILIIKHRDTGHGPLMVVDTSEEVSFWFALGLDWEKWRTEGNEDVAAPQNRAYVVVEDPAGERFETNGATGFLRFTYEVGSGAHNHYSPKLSGAYVLTGSINEPDKVLVQTTINVEIVEPTPTAVPTVAEPTQAALVARPTETSAEPEPGGEFEVDPWVPLFAGLLGVGGALSYLLSSGLLGPLPGGGIVAAGEATGATSPETPGEYPEAYTGEDVMTKVPLGPEIMEPEDSEIHVEEDEPGGQPPRKKREPAVEAPPGGVEQPAPVEEGIAPPQEDMSEPEVTLQAEYPPAVQEPAASRPDEVQVKEEGIQAPAPESVGQPPEDRSYRDDQKKGDAYEDKDWESEIGAGEEEQPVYETETQVVEKEPTSEVTVTPPVDTAVETEPGVGEDEIEEEEGVGEEAEEEGEEGVEEKAKPKVTLSLSKSSLIADGQDCVVARTAVACQDPAVDIGPIANSLSIGTGGWCYIGSQQREGNGVVAQIYASTPGSLQSLDAQAATISAAAPGAAGASETISVRPQVRAALWISPMGPVTLEADGDSCVTLHAGIRTTPQIASLEDQAASTIQFSKPSEWLGYQTHSGADSKSLTITAAYPGGDYALSPPSGELTIQVSADVNGQVLSKSFGVQLQALEKTVRTHPQAIELWLGGEEDYIQAKVYLANDPSQNLDDLTAGLSLRFEGEGSQYLSFEAQAGEGGYRVFWISASGEAAPGFEATVRAVIYHPSVLGITPGIAQIQVKSLPQAVIRHEPASLSLRPDGKNDEARVRAWVEWAQPVAGVDVNGHVADLGLWSEATELGWIEHQETDSASPGRKTYRIWVKYPHEEIGQQPPEVTAVLQATVDGVQIVQELPIEIRPLSTASIQAGSSSASLLANNQNTVEVWARLVITPPDETLEPRQLAESLTFEVDDETGAWLSQRQAGIRPSSGGGYEAYRVYAAQKPEWVEAAQELPPATIHVQGRAYGCAVKAAEAVHIAVFLSKPEITFELDKQPIRPDGQDSTTLTATVTLQPPDGSQNLAEIAELMTFELHPASEAWADFDDLPKQEMSHSKQIRLSAGYYADNSEDEPPEKVFCRVNGQLYGEAFQTEYYAIDLAPLPTARIATHFKREVNPSFRSDEILPDGKDWVRLSAWMDFEEAVTGINYTPLNDSIQFELAGAAADWLTESVEEEVAPNGATCIALGLRGQVPAGQEGDFPDAVTIQVTGEYARKTITKQVSLKLLPLPFLTADDDKVAVIAGGEAVEILVKVNNPGTGTWTFEHECSGDDPAKMSVKEERHSASEMCYILTGAGMDPKGKARVENRLEIKARLNEIELESIEVKVVVGLTGLQILEGTPIVMPLDGSTEREFKVRVTLLDIDEVVTDDETMRSPPTFTIPESLPKTTRNLLEAAELQFAFKDMEETEAGTQAIWTVTSQQAVPGDGVPLEAKVWVRARHTGEEYCKQIPFQVTTLKHIAGGTDWKVEYERCLEIIDKYIPYDEKAEFEKLVADYGQVLGAEGLTYLRREIWDAAAEAILAEGARWEESAKFWERQIFLMEWTEWAGDIAFDALVGTFLGPQGVIVLGLLKSFLISGLNAYQMGQSPEDWFWEQIKGILLMPGEMLVDPDVTQERLGVPVAYAVYITYQFIINIKVHKMGVFEAAKKAGGAVAKQLISKWLRQKVQQSAKVHGYTTYDDIELPPQTANPNQWDPSDPTFPRAVADFKAKVERGETVTLGDVLDIQKNAQYVRTLKECPDAKVREAFNEVWEREFVKPHGDHLVEELSSMPDEDWSGLDPRCFEVVTVRTYGADPSDVNTDLDRTVYYRKDPSDPDSPLLEIPWGKVHPFSKAYIEQKLPGISAEDLRVEITSSKHPEAGSVFSLYRYDEATGKAVRVDVDQTEYAQIVGMDAVKLTDPQDVSMTYRSKSDEYLHRGDPTEALAQSGKAVKFYRQALQNYRNQGLDVGNVPTQMEKAMQVVENLPTHHGGNPSQVDAYLQSLGVNGLADFNNKLSGLIEALKFAK